MIIQEIYDFLITCPELKNFLSLKVPRLSVDQLGTDTTEYVIQLNPVEPIVEKYIDGSSLRRCTFDFTSSELMNAETLVNIENNGFYERFSDWLDMKTMDGELPPNWCNIRAISNGFLFNETEQDKGLYRITIELIYYKPKEAKK